MKHEVKRANPNLFLTLFVVLSAVMFVLLQSTLSVKAAKEKDKVKLSSTSITLKEGESKTLKVSGIDKKTKATWSSSKKSIATVSNKGVVKAKKAGSAKITATVKGKKLTCKVTVKKDSATLKKIAFEFEDDDDEIDIVIGESLSLKVMGDPANALKGKTLKWSSSDTSIVVVDKNGKIKGIAEGEATITVKVGKLKAECTVNVWEEDDDTDDMSDDWDDDTDDMSDDWDYEDIDID